MPPISKPDLSGAYVKLSRARDHIAELESKIDKYLRSDFYRVLIEAEQDLPGFRISVQSIHELGTVINAAIGDAIGNLRSTLDYAAVALVYPVTGQTERVGFPFANDANGFKGEVTKASLSVCSQAIQDYFINDIQAYEFGKGHAYWALNKLRNIDKHRLLLAAAQVMSAQVSLRGDRAIMNNVTFNFLAGENSSGIGAPGNFEIVEELGVVFEILLLEPPIIEAPAISLLQGYAKDVENLLDALQIFV